MMFIFRLEKDVVILLKNNQRGIILLELLVAFSMLVMILFTLIPILVQIKLEENDLQQQREIQSFLHDELQLLSATLPFEQSPYITEININNSTITFTFEEDSPLLKGSAEWENEKYVQKKISLYYFP